MVKTKCIICGENLADIFRLTDAENNLIEETHQLPENDFVEPEAQVRFIFPNPRLLNQDIFIRVHKSCFDKVKALYPNFDNLGRLKVANFSVPVLNPDGTTFSLKNLSEFIGLNRI